jgi:hypothetical protein
MILSILSVFNESNLGNLNQGLIFKIPTIHAIHSTQLLNNSFPVVIQGNNSQSVNAFPLNSSILTHKSIVFNTFSYSQIITSIFAVKLESLVFSAFKSTIIVLICSFLFELSNFATVFCIEKISFVLQSIFSNSALTGLLKEILSISLLKVSFSELNFSFSKYSVGFSCHETNRSHNELSQASFLEISISRNLFI